MSTRPSPRTTRGWPRCGPGACTGARPPTCAASRPTPPSSAADPRAPDRPGPGDSEVGAEVVEHAAHGVDRAARHPQHHLGDPDVAVVLELGLVGHGAE